MDNSFLMSIYRYGIIGLFLEFMIYLSFLYLCFKRVRSNNFYALPIAFMCVYLITGIPANNFYELKTPYILAFMIGWFSSVSPQIIEHKKIFYLNELEGKL